MRWIIILGILATAAGWLSLPALHGEVGVGQGGGHGRRYEEEAD